MLKCTPSNERESFKTFSQRPKIPVTHAKGAETVLVQRLSEISKQQACSATHQVVTPTQAVISTIPPELHDTDRLLHYIVYLAVAQHG